MGGTVSGAGRRVCDCACYVNGRGGFFRRREDIAKVLPSKMRDFILIKARTKSETGFVI